MKLGPRHFLYLAICFIVGGFGLVILGQQDQSRVEQHEGEHAAITIIDLKETEDRKPLRTYMGIGLIAIGLILAARNLRVREQAESAEVVLTKKEEEIVDTIRRGLTNKEIAQEMNVSLSTVKSHVNNIYRKVGVNSRSELLKELNKIRV